MRTRARGAARTASVGLLLLLGACAGPDRPPDLVLVSIDSLRPDHLGVYGYERPTSPNLDALAAEGTVFDNAISTTTWTLPAHGSMLTSLYPEVHGANADHTRVPEGARLVSEVLHEWGYTTAAVVSAPYLHHSYGFDQGWDVYDDEATVFERRPENANPSHWGATSPKVHASALEAIEATGDAPLFLFVHYWDVHYDYAPPPPYDTRFDPDYEGDLTSLNFEFNDAIHAGMDPRDLDHLRALYDGEIAYTDSYVGRLFAVLRERGRWDETAIVVTADHGDEFFEHGQKGHRKNLYATTLDVPLIVKPPGGMTATRRVSTPVSIVDIAPTLLAFAGAPALEWSHGTSLVELMRGDDEAIGYRFASLFGRLGAVVDGDMKLMVSPDRSAARGPMLRLFDLRRDPGERTNLAARRPHVRDRLWEAYAEWSELAAEQAKILEKDEMSLDPDVERRLRDLGYIQ